MIAIIAVMGGTGKDEEPYVKCGPAAFSPLLAGAHCEQAPNIDYFFG